MSRSHCISLINQINDLFFRAHKVLCQALDLNLLVFVFEDFEHFVVV